MSATREQILKKATDIIAKARNTATIDNVLAVHDRIIKASLKSKSSTGAMSRPHLEVCHLRKGESGTLPPSQKPEKKKDTRPISPNTWKVKMPNGSEFMYHMSESGVVTKKELGKYRIPEYVIHADHIKNLHDTVTADHKSMLVNKYHSEHSGTAPEEKKPVNKVSKEELVKALADLDEPVPVKKSAAGWFRPNAIWGKTPPSSEPLPAPATHTPRPPMQLTRDTTPLSGHQLAARRAGLPADTPNLHKMSFPEMQALADSRQVTETRKQAATSGIHFGDRGEAYHRR